jgi:hypothetical protein
VVEQNGYRQCAGGESLLLFFVIVWVNLVEVDLRKIAVEV